MIVIIINNLSSRHNLDRASSSVMSIYNDRLLAATYLFELSGHLYEKERSRQQRQWTEINTIDEHISVLIRKYEGTMLTRQESVLWQDFKSSLRLYNNIKSDDRLEAGSFGRALIALKKLSSLQAKEGSSLYKDTRSNLSATALGAHLEIILAILTGVAALFLIGISRKTLDTFIQSPSLN